MGAKEIGHNLARERPKFGHNLVRKRNEVWAQFCRRLMKTWAQICKHKHFYIGCLKTQQQLYFFNGKKKIIKKINFLVFNNSGRALVNRAGRKPVRAGRSALINVPSWNTVYYLLHMQKMPTVLVSTFLKTNYSDFLLSQYVIQLSLHSALLFFSYEGDL